MDNWFDFATVGACNISLWHILKLFISTAIVGFIFIVISVFWDKFINARAKMGNKPATFKEWFLKLKSNAQTPEQLKDLDDFKDIFGVGWSAATEAMADEINRRDIIIDNLIETVKQLKEITNDHYKAIYIISKQTKKVKALKGCDR